VTAFWKSQMIGNIIAEKRERAAEHGIIFGYGKCPACGNLRTSKAHKAQARRCGEKNKLISGGT